MSDPKNQDSRLGTTFAVRESEDEASIPLARALRDQFTDMSWNQVRRLCVAGRVRVDGELVKDSRRSVSPGTPIEVLKNGVPSQVYRERRPHEVNIRYEDAHVLVVEKPSGMSTVPYDQGERGTLLDYVRDVWRRRGIDANHKPLMVVQRLDKPTSGVLVFAKSSPAQESLTHQLRKRIATRAYFAVVEGIVERDKGIIRTHIGQPKPGARRRSLPANAKSLPKEAVTHYQVVERYARTTLVRVHLETGRTHQIRVHMSELGHPLVGDASYQTTYEGETQHFGRVALHACTLGFEHPHTGKSMRFESKLPDDMVALLRGMGSKREDVNRMGDLPSWLKKRRGKPIKSLKELLDHTSEIADWNEGTPVKKTRDATVSYRPKSRRGGSRSKGGPQGPKSGRTGNKRSKN